MAQCKEEIDRAEEKVIRAFKAYLKVMRRNKGKCVNSYELEVADLLWYLINLAEKDTGKDILNIINDFEKYLNKA